MAMTEEHSQPVLTRLRTVKNAADYFRKVDPDSAVTQSYIRALIRTGQIPYLVAEGWHLVSIEALEDFLREKKLTRQVEP
jgi:hypothetical protein